MQRQNNTHEILIDIISREKAVKVQTNISQPFLYQYQQVNDGFREDQREQTLLRHTEKRIYA